MEDNTITLTETELQAKIEDAVAKATQELEKKHNAEMYNARKEIKELKNASLSQEERQQHERLNHENNLSPLQPGISGNARRVSRHDS